MNQVLDVIGKGAAQSWQMDNRGKTMVAGSSTSALPDWMRKDLGLVLDEAKRNARACPSPRWSTSSMPMCSTWAAALGHSSLIKRLK
jgi:3-hydroxyisobutyrate dehydrogenase/2-hydroxy-3-oxopropionate reductase